ncbi:MAG: di-heme-cytochrome C peroxidase [Cypionkella sp.]|nr:di-heme-cytochrome C peroxidase [Cypionkella sp.]
MKTAFLPILFVSAILGAGQSKACDVYDDSLGQIWPESARKVWYETSQGSRLMPDAWYRALRRADDGTMLAGRDSMQRYGFAFCDDDAVDPIGFVLDKDADRPPAIGLTCAACHTGTLNDGTQQMTVHAGAADMDFQRFSHDVFAAMRKVWAGPFDSAKTNPDWQAFALAAMGSDAGDAKEKALHDQVSNWLQYRRDIQASIDDGGTWGHGRQDAVQVILNTVATLSDSKVRGGLPASTAPVSIPSAWLAPHTARVQWNGSASKSKDIGLAGPISTGAMIRNVSEVIGVFAEVTLPSYADLAEGDDLTVQSSIRLGNLIALERALAEVTPPKWPKVWGDIDRSSADYLAGKGLYDAHCAACHARIDPANPLAEILDATGRAMAEDAMGGAPFVRVVNAFDIAGQTGPAVGTDPMMACNAATHSSWSGKMTAFTNIFGVLQSASTRGLSGVTVERFPLGIPTLRLIEDLSIRILWDKRSEIIATQTADLRAKTARVMAALQGKDLQIAGGDWVVAQAEAVPTPTPVTHHLRGGG